MRSRNSFTDQESLPTPTAPPAATAFSSSSAAAAALPLSPAATSAKSSLGIFQNEFMISWRFVQICCAFSHRNISIKVINLPENDFKHIDLKILNAFQLMVK